MDGVNAASAGSPRKPSSLQQRLLSTVLLAPLVLAPLWAGVVPAALLTLTIVALGLYELFVAFAQAGLHPRLFPGSLTALLLILAAALRALYGWQLEGAILLAVLLISLLSELAYQHRPGQLSSWALSLAGPLYLAWPMAHFILLRALEMPMQPGWLAWSGMAPGTAWIYAVIGITWATDSGAYFVGQRFGRSPLAPALSPHKTWEGALGGFVAALAAALLCVPLFGLPISYPTALLFGLVGGVFAQLGDLVESLIKRQTGVKDASQLIPGHGGVLDRTDSLIFTGPLMYYLILLLT